MEIDARDVVNDLLAQLSQKTLENAKQNAYIKKLEEEDNQKDNKEEE